MFLSIFVFSGKKKAFAELFIASYQLHTILVPICFESTYLRWKEHYEKIFTKKH